MLVHLLILLPVFLTALVAHEVSHGWVANRLGDPTAKAMGRLSLNPLRHVDPIGTVALPLLLILTRSPIVFGWAKPVPIDFTQLGHPKRDLIWVGLAGPAANLALAGGVAGILRFWDVPIDAFWGAIGLTAVVMNLALAVFNLIPIPPLDGSRVLVGLLPVPLARQVAALEPYGFLILIGLLMLGLLNRAVWPVVLAGCRWLGVTAL